MKIMNPYKLFKRKTATFFNMFSSIAVSKWDYITLAVDYLYSKYILGATNSEYFYYQFYNLKNRYRKQFILNRHREKFINVNTRAFTRYKYAFYKHIPDLYNREIIIAPFCGEDVFIDFLRRHGKIVVKPDQGSLGKDLEVVTYENEQASKMYFSRFSPQRPFICEEFIRQHSVLQTLNPTSVNTIRICTYLKPDGDVEIVSAVLKTGAANQITDNMSLGGIGAQIDVKSGIVCTFGKDFDFHTYTHHPVTGVQIIGMQMPNWNKVISLVTQAHKRLPQCLIYGWDIAITETGVDIVEANSRPGSRILQVMDGIPKGKEILPLIRRDRLKDKRKAYKSDFDQMKRKYGYGIDF